MNRRLKLQTKITLLTIVIVFISLITTIIFVTNMRLSSIKNQTEINIMNAAQIVSHSPMVIESLTNRRLGGEVQRYVKSILDNTEKVDILVVADMNGIRYAHPENKKIGLSFVGGDEYRVVKYGEKYISEALGTMGGQMRAFTPIIDSKGKQLGFVMASTLTENLAKEKQAALIKIAYISLAGLLMGIIGSLILSRNIKDSLLGFEPEQITKLYLQRKEVLDTLSEGIIAVDEKHRVTIFNKAAIEIMDIKSDFIIGNEILNLVSNSRLPEIMRSGIPEYNKEMIINDTIIFSSRIPIKQGKQVVGAVAIFRDKTEVTRLAEEMTGVKQIVEALRANTHEFMNKLHVILGLIQIGELDEAKKYILNITEQQQQKVSVVMKKIEEPTIAALILGKISRAKESGVNLRINNNSSLQKRIDRISNNALITIIGNLIENSIENINTSSKKNKNIEVLILETDDEIIIEVDDTGTGIAKENLERIFESGFSTKGENRGRGLSLIKETVNNLDGCINISTKFGEGTKFLITIPKGEKND